jgi:hypothetical protein
MHCEYHSAIPIPIIGFAAKLLDKFGGTGLTFGHFNTSINPEVRPTKEPVILRSLDANRV